MIDTNISGEMMGDFNDIFFKKDGKSILPQSDVQESKQSITPEMLEKQIAETANGAIQTNTDNKKEKGTTIIQISKDVIGSEEDVNFTLTQLEEKRRNTTTIKGKHFIDINTGDEITVLEHTEMYNGTNLFTVKFGSTQKVITYPRSMFVGREKQFVPKDFYIREAERSIEDTIDKYGVDIMELVKDSTLLEETSDGKYLEVILDTPIDILGGMIVPDKIKIPVKRMFDMEYKLLMLEYVICLDNKIASLLFEDVWF